MKYKYRIVKYSSYYKIQAKFKGWNGLFISWTDLPSNFNSLEETREYVKELQEFDEEIFKKEKEKPEVVEVFE